MDPATAIGVASSAITFVDFSRKLLRRAYEIYRSSDGRSKEETRAIADLRDFNRLAQNVERSLTKFGSTSGDLEIAVVLEEVRGVSHDFGEVVKKLVSRKDPGMRLLTSLKTAAKSLYGNSVVSELQERLDEIQSRTIRFVLFAIW